jgi:hypothetical protein
MAGAIVTILPKTTFDFSATATSGGGQLVPLGPAIDVTQYTNVGLVVRLHSANITNVNEVAFTVYEDGFLPNNAAAYPGPYTYIDMFFQQSDVFPSAKFAYDRVNSAYATLGMTIYRDVGTFVFSVSADLYLRNGDETPMALDNGVWRPVQQDAPSLVSSVASMMPPPGATGALSGGVLSVPSAPTDGASAAYPSPTGGGSGGVASKGITIAEIEATGGPMRQYLIFKYMQENGIPFLPTSGTKAP